MPYLSWMLALLAAAAVVVIVAIRMARRGEPDPLPTEWKLKLRPVFSTGERRAFRVLREAFPDQLILTKLPLVRFCQPEDPSEGTYWYDLLGTHHVTFAVCSANGRVLAAIDLDNERVNARRGHQIKQAVLDACRIHYLRCTSDTLPSAAELQSLLPDSVPVARGQSGSPGTAGELDSARDALATTVAIRRAARSALSKDSPNFQDSFFALDSRQDSTLSSGFGALGTRSLAGTLTLPDSLAGLTMIETDDADIAGIVEADAEPRLTDKALQPTHS